MKKYYEAPSVEKIAFAYRDQVVVASPGETVHTCGQTWHNDKFEGGNNGACTMGAFEAHSGITG